MGALAFGSVEPAGIVFGPPLIGLGIATWAFTAFGSAGRGVAGTGSIVGNLSLLMVFGIFFLMIWIIQGIARNL